MCALAFWLLLLLAVAAFCKRRALGIICFLEFVHECRAVKGVWPSVGSLHPYPLQLILRPPAIPPRYKDGVVSGGANFMNTIQDVLTRDPDSGITASTLA